MYTEVMVQARLRSSKIPIRLCIVICRDQCVSEEVRPTSRQVVGDGVFDYFDELHVSLGCSDAVLVQQLHHQPREPLECPGDPGGGVHLDQHVLGGSDENL